MHKKPCVGREGQVWRLAPSRLPAHREADSMNILPYHRDGGKMENEVWKYFLTQGPWAILFVWSFYTWRKDSKDREESLLKTLNAFSEKYDLIREEIRELAEEFKRRQRT